MTLFPFNLTNYALGLTRISLTHYVLASLVCMVPGTLAYTWLGHAGREAAAGNTAAIRYGLIAVALMAAIAFLPRLLRRLRSQEQPRWVKADELASRLKGAAGIAVIDVRGPDEFMGPLGHIADASNMPMGELPKRLVEIDAAGNLLGCRLSRLPPVPVMMYFVSSTQGTEPRTRRPTRRPAAPSDTARHAGGPSLRRCRRKWR